MFYCTVSCCVVRGASLRCAAPEPSSCRGELIPLQRAGRWAFCVALDYTGWVLRIIWCTLGHGEMICTLSSWIRPSWAMSVNLLDEHPRQLATSININHHRAARGPQNSTA